MKRALKSSSLILWLHGAEGTKLSRKPRDQPVCDDRGESLSPSFMREIVGRRAVNDSLQPPCWTVLSPSGSQPIVEPGRGTSVGHFCPTWDLSNEVSSWPCWGFHRAALQSEPLPIPSSFLHPLPSQVIELPPGLKALPASCFCLSTGSSPNKSLALQIPSWCPLSGGPKLTQIQNNSGLSLLEKKFFKKTKLLGYPMCYFIGQY